MDQLEQEAWDHVEKTVKKAKAMHFDGCHKIYLSMDKKQVKTMEGHGYESVTPNFDKLRNWYDVSCGLRFVSAVSTRKGFSPLIPQFFEEDDEED